MKTLLAHFLIFCFYFAFVNGSKILYMMPFASKSQRIAFNPLMEELANRGHQLTVISPFTMFDKKNIKEIEITENGAALINPTKMKKFFESVGLHPLITMPGIKYVIEPSCVNYLKHPATKELLKAGKQFDLVIVSMFMNECGLATAPLLGNHIMYHSSSTVIPWVGIFVPSPPSYVPNIMLPYTSRMTFFQRVDNLVTNVGIKFVMDYFVLPAMQRQLKEHVPEAPTITEAKKLVSFSLLNADPVLISPRPLMPNMVNVGGLQCGKTKPIPKEYEDFFQSSGNDGVILFSLGSNFPSSALGEEKINSILKVFEQLKQKVIWKFEEELKNLPPNVKIAKWLPQQDLLAHPKMRLFITHGGLHSLQEAVYHGVPVVAIPLFGDQAGNVARVEELQIGRRISVHNFTAQSIYEALNMVLNDKTYAENMKKYSAIFKDQYQEPVQRAVFWIEYVIRHKGAHHFRSPGEDLNFFQYFLLDVIGLLLLIVLFGVLLLYFGTRFMLRKICKYKNKCQQDSDKKKKQ